MANKKYEVPEAGSDAYLTYSVQDAPDLSYEAWLHSRGKSYTWLRRNRLANDPGYTHWKQRMTQNYQNYLDSYNQNYNSEASRRLRLENTGFSGQYLANGIGGSSSAPISLNPQFGSEETQPGTKANKGLEKVMESLQLMSNAGIAMKNFGEGKAAMKYADEMGAARLTTEQNKGEGLFYDAGLKRYRYMTEEMLYNSPEQYGYEVDPSTGKWSFTGKLPDGQTVSGRNLRLESFLDNMSGVKAQNVLRGQQKLLNQLSYDNRKEYEAATMKAQKELLEGKKELQDIENEYAESLKKMGLAMPFLKSAMEALKLFL